MEIALYDNRKWVMHCVRRNKNPPLPGSEGYVSGLDNLAF